MMFMLDADTYAYTYACAWTYLGGSIWSDGMHGLE